jgi:DNA transformation protein
MNPATRHRSLPARLEDVPGIGRAIAADLRSVGVEVPAQLTRRAPLDLYLSLAPGMAHRHDPCVLYTLLAARHYLDTGEALPWWTFAQAGRRLLAQAAGGR